MRRTTSPVALLLALLVSACSENGNAQPSKQSPPPAQPSAPAARQMSLEEAQAALPGFPIERFPDWLRGPLVEAARDEFVYDGAPFTLAGCIKEDKPCKRHAIRGLTLVANQLAGGLGASEALAGYNRYYGSFAADQRQSIDLAGAPCLGKDDAKVTLVEFADYQCPYCAAAAPVLHQVAQENDEVRLCFLHFPLPQHDLAHSASQAAVFAQRHGRFWQVHEAIFRNQQRLSAQVIRELVAQNGLDADAFIQAVQSGELAQVVDAQRERGRALGITGTPAVFINGRKHELPLSPEMLRFTIEDEIEWQTNGGKWAAE